MKVVAVICANGRGHWKRTAAILKRAQRPDWRLTVVTEISADEVRRTLGATTEVVAGVVSPGPGWVGPFDEARLLGWEARLHTVAALRDADRVLSDNLIQVLAVRPDASLLGSFLWSDVLEGAHPNDATVRRFVERERSLLEKHRPPMICVNGLTMPGVLQRTQARPVGVMADFEPIVGPASQVALLGGGTGVADAALATLARQLLPGVLGGERLAQAVPGVEPFDFSPAGWGRVSVAVVRPGMGTLTDAITAGVPVVTLPEPENPEMVFLGQAVERLGLGRSAATLADVPRRVAEVLAARDAHRAALARLPLNGLDQAAAALFST